MDDLAGSAGWTVRALRRALAAGLATPTALAQTALDRANSNAGRNTYLWRDPAWTLAEAARAEAMPHGEGGEFGDGRPALWGLPVSIKDCFDLSGAPTSCGVRFYRDLNGAAAEDSWVARRLRRLGAVITGKTHLHPLAYGITGENPEFGDCTQPGDPTALTGGSSSGAAASVLEGSAVAAIGTDTGGSVRAPAALCHLAGYRATLGRGGWQGAAHLAARFDTLGWLFRDLEDTPLLAGFYAPDGAQSSPPPSRFAVIDPAFLHDCEPVVMAGLEQVAAELEAMGLERAVFEPDGWDPAFEMFAPLQAWEAARIHAGHHAQFEPALRERLEWGARIGEAEHAQQHQRHAAFVEQMRALFARHQLLLLPATPVARLAAGADHSQTRPRLLRYTVPFSLAGVPVVTVPCPAGGVQIAAWQDQDEALAALATRLGALRREPSASAC